MDFENLALARDLLYLSAGLAGLFCGCILSLFRRRISARQRNRRITLALCIASAAVLSLAGMLICSGGKLLFAGPFLLPAGIGFVVFGLAFRFPRAAAFPLFLVLGLLIVWLGYTFLRFPVIVRAGTPLASIHREQDGTLSIRFAYRTGYDEGSGVLSLEDNGEAPEFSASRIHFDERYPLVGGEVRGMITRVHRMGVDYYAQTLPAVVEEYPLGISLRSCHSDPGPLPAGTNLVLFDGEAIELRRPLAQDSNF